MQERVRPSPRRKLGQKKVEAQASRPNLMAKP
jgi:hypothetical protein